MDFNPPANIFSVASKLNGRLPDHHPNLLIQYLAWGMFNLRVEKEKGKDKPYAIPFLNVGQHDIVKHLLLLLYRFVKLAVQTNGSFTDVPIPLLKLLNDSEVSRMKLCIFHLSKACCRAEKSLETIKKIMNRSFPWKVMRMGKVVGETQMPNYGERFKHFFLTFTF